MANQKKEQEIRNCDEQIKNLYAYFGKFLYENLQQENLFYLFNPEFDGLEKDAEKLLAEINATTEKSSARANPPQKDAKPSAEEIKTSAQKTKTRAKTDPAPKKSLPGKEPSTKETKSAKNVKILEKVEPPQHTTMDQIARRGLIEPYTKLNIAIYAMRQDLGLLYNDLDWLAALLKSSLYFIDQAKSQEDILKFNELKEAINLSLGQLTEVITSIMDTKKRSLESLKEKSDLTPSKIETHFLKEAQEKIKTIAGNIDSLIDHAKDLFENVKHSYETDINRQNALLERNTILAEKTTSREAAPKTENHDISVAEELADLLEEEEAEDATMQSSEIIASAYGDLAIPQAPESEAAPEKLEEDRVVPQETKNEEFDPALLEAAARKLLDKNTTKDEKLSILNTLIHNIPGTISDFIRDYFSNLELDAKKSFLDVLAQIDDPILIDIYQEFLNEKDSLLRLNGIIGLSQMNHPDARSMILSLTNDPDSSIRRLVANCLNWAGSDAEMSAIVKLINDIDEGVSRIAIRKLGKSRTRFAFIHLIPKLSSDDMKIRKEAIDALRSILGTDLGYKYMAPENLRIEAINRWQKMWKDNQINPRFLRDAEETALMVKEKYSAKPAIVVKKTAAKSSVPTIKKPSTKFAAPSLKVSSPMLTVSKHALRIPAHKKPMSQTPVPVIKKSQIKKPPVIRPETSAQIRNRKK